MRYEAPAPQAATSPWRDLHPAHPIRQPSDVSVPDTHPGGRDAEWHCIHEPLIAANVRRDRRRRRDTPTAQAARQRRVHRVLQAFEQVMTEDVALTPTEVPRDDLRQVVYHCLNDFHAEASMLGYLRNFRDRAWARRRCDVKAAESIRHSAQEELYARFEDRPAPFPWPESPLQAVFDAIAERYPEAARQLQFCYAGGLPPF